MKMKTFLYQQTDNAGILYYCPETGQTNIRAYDRLDNMVGHVRRDIETFLNQIGKNLVYVDGQEYFYAE